MASWMSEFEHLQIPLEAIKSATDNFNENHVIGEGGFGKVYKGELLLSEGLTMVALKRLDRKHGPRDPDHWKEIMTLTQYKHENLISLLGFCKEGDEMILAYEYMCNGSLDKYLGSYDLSWIQRLRICIGVAHGVSYLHDPGETGQLLIHRDIKSATVLLDQNWNPKVADFDQSAIFHLNQISSFVYNAVGTKGYCDPLYFETGIMTKDSDVYSLGVVLFEVLCGRLCVELSNGQTRISVHFWKKCYEENKLDEIIFNSIREQISPDCLKRFIGIIYQCLKRNREDRPSMAEVVRELEVALQYQEEHIERNKKQVVGDEEESDTEEGDFWETKLPQGWREMINMFNIPRAIYTIKRELFSYLEKGILFDEGNKFLWINNDGKKSLLISAKRFLELDEEYDHRWVFLLHSNARFSVVAHYHYGKWHKIRCQIKTSILSLGTMYAANLIFKYSKKPNTELKHLELMSVKWKTEKLSVFSTHNAELTLDNWYKIRLWNFFNHGPNADFDIVLERLSYYDDPVESGLLIQGIEFKAIETIQREETERKATITLSRKEVADDDLYWKTNLPNNYQEYIQMTNEPLLISNEKELYLLLCRGFLAYHGKLWVSLRKSTSGICTILPATHVLAKDTSIEPLETLPLSESRFKKVKVLGNDDWYLFTCRLRAYMFSTHYNYACYLVFNFEENRAQSNDTRFFKSEYRLGDTVQGTVHAHLNLIPPVNIPIIEAKNELGSHDSSNIQHYGGSGKTVGHIPDVVNSWMEERNDGWMEVRLSKPLYHLENHVSLEIKLWKSEGRSLSGIIVEGIEFRPMHGV